MTVRSILRLGDPLLRLVAEPVEDLGAPELRELVADMLETMQAAHGAGIAAPQIGASKRVLVFGVESTPRYPDAKPIPRTILINPSFEVTDHDRIGHWEGCLSVPGLRGFVSRPRGICYRGFDLEGRPIERSVSGFHAAVFQHECDHLDGVLFPDRVEHAHLIGFEPELEAAGKLRQKWSSRAT